MIHAYDKLYLSVAQKNLACMLDYMVNDLKRPLETVWQWFCRVIQRHGLNEVTVLW